MPPYSVRSRLAAAQAAYPRAGCEFWALDISYWVLPSGYEGLCPTCPYLSPASAVKYR
jgi:hypothetical protein